MTTTTTNAPPATAAPPSTEPCATCGAQNKIGYVSCFHCRVPSPHTAYEQPVRVRATSELAVEVSSPETAPVAAESPEPSRPEDPDAVLLPLCGDCKALSVARCGAEMAPEGSTIALGTECHGPHTEGIAPHATSLVRTSAAGVIELARQLASIKALELPADAPAETRIYLPPPATPKEVGPVTSIAARLLEAMIRHDGAAAVDDVTIAACVVAARTLVEKTKAE